jgi:FKBP-type peptidyl-prolyl cis-trans isomerase
LEQKKLDFKTDQEKVSYSLGYQIGQSVRRFSGEVDLEILIKGFRESAKNYPSQIAVPEMRKVLQNFQQQMRKKMETERAALGEKNKIEGETFLLENAKKEGVKTTKSGLQYKLIAEGKGDQPKATDRVKVNYKGTLINGKEFDSSYSKGAPQVFLLKQMIPGFIEGVQLMKVGSKIKLFIPPNLAYKNLGRGPLVGPHAVLIFDIELLEIVKESEKQPEKKK